MAAHPKPSDFSDRDGVNPPQQTRRSRLVICRQFVGNTRQRARLSRATCTYAWVISGDFGLFRSTPRRRTSLLKRPRSAKGQSQRFKRKVPAQWPGVCFASRAKRSGRRFSLPLPSPPAEQAATRSDQAGKTSAHDGTGNGGGGHVDVVDTHPPTSVGRELD